MQVDGRDGFWAGVRQQRHLIVGPSVEQDVGVDQIGQKVEVGKHTPD